MIIRPYTETDFQGIARVIHSCQTEECWPYYYPNGWDEERIRREFAPLKGYRDPLFLVSESEGQVTGLIAGHDLDSFIDFEVPHLKPNFEEQSYYKNNFFYLRDIIIRRDHQKGTLGMRLFQALRKHVLKTGHSSNLVTRTPPRNEVGKAFFKKLGFCPIFQDKNPERIYYVFN